MSINANQLTDQDVDADADAVSVSSADQALLEWLGVPGFDLVRGEQGDQGEQDETVDNDNQHGDLVTVNAREPPLHCQRPQTPYRQPLLLETSRHCLTAAQCDYMIQWAYRATNNGGKTYGPNYVTAAVHAANSENAPALVVQLQEPNHHKVCVFGNEMISTWIENAIRQGSQHKIHQQIVAWCHANQFTDAEYRIHPRLRLLRYDAADQDVFLPHYDATTTRRINGQVWQSRLTILIYLNEGRGVQFHGGDTLYLNALHPSPQTTLSISPQQGKMVIFNHELYHASQPLTHQPSIVVRQPPTTYNPIQGGSKFVLRSDILFRANVVPSENNYNHGAETTKKQQVVETSSSSSDAVPTLRTVEHVVERFRGNTTLSSILQSLDMLHVTLPTFLAAGTERLQAM